MRIQGGGEVIEKSVRDSSDDVVSEGIVGIWRPCQFLKCDIKKGERQLSFPGVDGVYDFVPEKGFSVFDEPSSPSYLPRRRESF